jgi:hypothetical protein
MPTRKKTLGPRKGRCKRPHCGRLAVKDGMFLSKKKVKDVMVLKKDVPKMQLEILFKRFYHTVATRLRHGPLAWVC